MKTDQRTNVTGLRLPRRALDALRERGIFAQPSVGLHHQHLAKRYVVRGVESGGAAGDVGRYVSFAREDGQPVECLHPVESIGVNGPHSIVVAPVLIRLDMLRKGCTYELLITQHQPSSTLNGTRPQLALQILFRGVHGRLELFHLGKDIGRGTVLPSFYSRSGEGIGIPKRFRSAVRALTVAVNCQGCEHCHYTIVRQNKKDTSPVTLPPEKATPATNAVPRRNSNDPPTRPQESPLVRNELDSPLSGPGAGDRNGGLSGVCGSEAAGDTHQVRGELASNI